VPADLDLKPYRDEHDEDLVKRMLKSLEKAPPAGIDPELVKRAVARHMPHLMPAATGKGRK